MILFYGGLNLSLPVLRRVWVSLGLLVVPGVVLTAVVTGAAAYAVFDLSWTAALLLGAVLAPTDPAILIPLFVGSRLREKVAQTVVAESAFNDPTGAALALAFAGVLVNGGGVLEPLGVRRRPGDQHGDRDRRRPAAGGRDIEPPGRHLAPVGRPGRPGRDRHRLLLARHGRRERVSGRVPGGPDRRQHGAPGPGHALRARGRHAPVRRQPLRPRDAARLRRAGRQPPARRPRRAPPPRPGRAGDAPARRPAADGPGVCAARSRRRLDVAARSRSCAGHAKPASYRRRWSG